jgi:hypothetical protein
VRRARIQIPVSKLSFMGFLLGTASALLAIGSALYAIRIGGFGYREAKLLRILAIGLLLALAGLVLSLLRYLAQKYIAMARSRSFLRNVIAVAGVDDGRIAGHGASCKFTSGRRHGELNPVVRTCHMPSPLYFLHSFTPPTPGIPAASSVRLFRRCGSGREWKRGSE